MALDYKAIGGAVSDAGGAVSSLLGAFGANAEVSRYKAAANSANLDAQLAKESGGLQELAAERKNLQTLGAQQAQIASNGFADSGTALDLMRDSTTQAALQKALIGMQTGQQVAGYEAQANAAEAEAKAARGSAFGNIVGAVFKAGAAGAQIAMLA